MRSNASPPPTLRSQLGRVRASLARAAEAHPDIADDLAAALALLVRAVDAATPYDPAAAVARILDAHGAHDDGGAAVAELVSSDVSNPPTLAELVALLDEAGAKARFVAPLQPVTPAERPFWRR